jgi:hypothetical protein
MEKTVPAKLPEQLAFPLEEPTPPKPETGKDRPQGVWRTLRPKSRASVKERWVAVMREVASDARE